MGKHKAEMQQVHRKARVKRKAKLRALIAGKKQKSS
jgi:hypothetical protein